MNKLPKDTREWLKSHSLDLDLWDIAEEIFSEDGTAYGGREYVLWASNHFELFAAAWLAYRKREEAK